MFNLDDFYASTAYVETQQNLHAIISSIAMCFGLSTSLDLIIHLQQSQALISGSYPLLVLFPDLFVPNDLDIFLSSTSPQSSSFVQWIEDTCGYRNVGTFSNYQYTYGTGFAEHISAVTKHEKLIGNTICSINIIFIQKQWLFRAIAKFPSTVTMNFISHAGFISLYPKLTLAKKGLELYPGKSDWINKYCNRGFDIRHSLLDWHDISPHHCGEHSYCPASQREIMDTHTMFVPFNNGDPLDRCLQMEWLGGIDADVYRDWQITAAQCVDHVEFAIFIVYHYIY